MMIIIGSSLARAFGIAGAASIIRFRTPVEDARDITVLFILMGLGMAAGLGGFAVAGLGTVFLCAMFPILNLFASDRPRTMMVEIEAEGRDFPAASRAEGVCRQSRRVRAARSRAGRRGHGALPHDARAARFTGGPEQPADGRWQSRHQECLLVAAQARLTRRRIASSSSRPSAGRRCSTSSRTRAQRLVLSLFRCNDFGVLDALAAALERGVKVEAILTKRAKGGKKSLRKLWEALEEMGAIVHRYGDPVVKYHAKYLVADGKTALVATLNPTKKCFSRTWDFVLTTDERSVVRSLSTLFALDAAGERVLPRHRISPRLIVGPEGARARMRALLTSARHSIRILDHKLSDPDLVALLRERREEGIVVSVIGRQPIGPLVPHGKARSSSTRRRAVLGSMAMSALSLDFRREVSIVTETPAVVRALNTFYQELSAKAGPSLSLLPGDRVASRRT